MNKSNMPPITGNLKAIYQFWLALPRREGMKCPSFTDINIGQLGPIADTLFVNELIGDGVVKSKLIGAALVRLLGRDITGENVISLKPLAAQGLERRYYHSIATKPCAGVIVRVERQVRPTPYAYRSIHLPVLNRGGEVAFVIGSSEMLSDKVARREYGFTSGHPTAVIAIDFIPLSKPLPLGDN